MSIIYYQSHKNDDIEQLRFGYLLNGEVGRHYMVDGENVHIMPIGGVKIDGSPYVEIDRPAFDRLLARWVLPPAFEED